MVKEDGKRLMTGIYSHERADMAMGRQKLWEGTERDQTLKNVLQHLSGTIGWITAWYEICTKNTRFRELYSRYALIKKWNQLIWLLRDLVTNPKRDVHQHQINTKNIYFLLHYFYTSSRIWELNVEHHDSNRFFSRPQNWFEHV